MSALHNKFQEVKSLPRPFEKLYWVKFDEGLMAKMGLTLSQFLVYLLGLLSHSEQRKIMVKEYSKGVPIFTVSLKMYDFWQECLENNHSFFSANPCYPKGLFNRWAQFAYVTTTIFIIAFSQHTLLYLQSIKFPLELHSESILNIYQLLYVLYGRPACKIQHQAASSIRIH